MFGLFKKQRLARPVPPPESIRTRESPSVWDVTLGLVARLPGHLPAGDFFYQVIAIRDGVESPPQITPAAAHIDGSAISLTIQRGGEWDEPAPDRYRILRENKVIAEVVAAKQGLFTDYLDVGEDLLEKNSEDDG